MTKYLAGVLSVIAVGVLLIAYGLLNPRASMDASMGVAPAMQPVGLSDPVAMRMPVSAAPAGYAPYGYAAPAAAPAYAPSYGQPVAMTAPVSRPVPVSYVPAEPRRSTTTRYVERRPARDWKRTAMIIGGSSATGAGVGAMIGGKKGALIGAALGGGASTLYETLK